jgi:hypothetical protein
LTTEVSIPNDFEKTSLRGTIQWEAKHVIEVDLADIRLGPRVAGERLQDGGGMIFDTHPVDDPPAQEPDSPEFIYARLPRDEQNRKHGKRVRFLSTQPIVSQLPYSRSISAKYRKPTSCLVDEMKSMRFLDLSPDAMRLPSFPGQTILGDRGENLSSVLQAICNDVTTKKALAEWIRELTPIDVVDFDFIPDQTGRILVSLVESNGQKTSVYSASDGTLRFLAIIAALLGPDPARFYFLEEIDNGIHPTRLGLLLQLIEQKTRQGDIQVVATTHSPQLLAMLNNDSREHAVLVYRHTRNASAQVQRVMDIPSVKEVLEKQNLARLHETGWLENAMAFSEPQEVSE